MIEKVEMTDAGCEIREAVYPWQHVRKMGEDIVRGEIILPAHHRIRAFDQGALMAAGVMEISVSRKPRVLIIPTGSEVVPPEEVTDPIRPGLVLEVNGQVLQSMAEECGAECTLARPVPDRPEEIRDAVLAGIGGNYDIVLIIAGSSAGSKDYTPAVLRESGTPGPRVTVMPGKPTPLAAVADRPVVGIPGYPVSAAVSFREFVRPLLFQVQGLEPRNAGGGGLHRPETPLQARPRGAREVILGRIGPRIVAIPHRRGRDADVAGARRRHPAYSAGNERLFRGEKARSSCSPPRELEHRLLTLGSHDLTIDCSPAPQERPRDGSPSPRATLGAWGLLAVEKDRPFRRLPPPGHRDRGLQPLLPRPFHQEHPGHAGHTGPPLAGTDAPEGEPEGDPGNDRPDAARPPHCQPPGGLRHPDPARLRTRQGGDRPGRDPGVCRRGVHTHECGHGDHLGTGGRGTGDHGRGLALDLDFIPVTRERYDLVIPTPLMKDPRIVLVLEIIRSPGFRSRS